MDIDYPQNAHGWLPEVFGCKQNESAVQRLGSVITREGRLLTFPNVFQHRVLPFGLADRTKPGHRKILALFLVDPHIRIISSANVPCQQRDWWEEALRSQGTFPRKLPQEMLKEIMDGVDEFPIGMKEAKKLRLELMEERKAFVRKQDMKFKEPEFSLCEH